MPIQTTTVIAPHALSAVGDGEGVRSLEEGSEDTQCCEESCEGEHFVTRAVVDDGFLAGFRLEM
jgi:hypothetical protein